MRASLATLMLAAGLGLSIQVAAAPAAYVAVFAAPVVKARIVSSDRLWTCADSTCVSGGQPDSAPQHVCSRLARALGPLTSFAVREQAFDAVALATCNAKAG